MKNSSFYVPLIIFSMKLSIFPIILFGCSNSSGLSDERLNFWWDFLNSYEYQQIRFYTTASSVFQPRTRIVKLLLYVYKRKMDETLVSRHVYCSYVEFSSFTYARLIFFANQGGVDFPPPEKWLLLYLRRAKFVRWLLRQTMFYIQFISRVK